MQAPFADYMERLQKLNAHIEQALEGLPAEALDWVPGPDMSSMSVLVVHTTGAQRYYIGDVAGQDPSNRVREAEFRARGLDVATLKARLAQVTAYAPSVLDRLTIQDLEAQRTAPDGEKYSVAWALAHALEHTGIHVGHIQIMRQLWDQRQHG